jgi:hypothetical protein
MIEVALFEYFNTQLEETTQCPNKRCPCLAILGDASTHASIAKYLTWFEQKISTNKTRLFLNGSGTHPS